MDSKGFGFKKLIRYWIQIPYNAVEPQPHSVVDSGSGSSAFLNLHLLFHGASNEEITEIDNR